MGGHCLARVCLGVVVQFCCFSPCLWLEVWFPGHRYTSTGSFKKHPWLLSVLPCFQGYCSRAQNVSVYVHLSRRVSVFTYTCIYRYTMTCTCKCIHTEIHIYTCIYAYISACSEVAFPAGIPHCLSSAPSDSAGRKLLKESLTRKPGARVSP